MRNGPGHRLSDEELAQLRWAYQHLEHPSLAARLTSRLATPIEESLNLLPKTWRKRLDKATESSVCASLRLAIGSLANLETARANTWMPKFVAAGAGAAGGFLGPVTLLAELPVTTVLMLRAIADIARSEGEDLSQTDARLACVQVFALGGRTSDDDTADLGYYGLRVALGLYFERDILEFAANVQGPHIPAVIQMIRAISARFGVVISDKAAAQMGFHLYKPPGIGGVRHLSQTEGPSEWTTTRNNAAITSGWKPPSAISKRTMRRSPG